MKIPVVGPTYQMNALSFGVQRCINLYPILTEAANTKSVAALVATPGLSDFAEVGGGPIRGAFSSRKTGRAFVVSGAELYELYADGSSTLRGTLSTFIEKCTIVENGTQLAICDGQTLYTLTYSGNAFAEVTDPDFPGAGTITYQDGYGIFNRPSTNEVYITAINDFTSIDALDFTTVQSSPDNLIAVLADKSNIWMFCQESVEVFENTGNASFPLERIGGAIIPTGCAAALTPQVIDNTVVWLGVDKQGRGVVWKAEGYSAVRVSTQAIERRIDEAEDFTESYAWVYHEQGHVFYVLQIKSLDTTLVLDMATKQWHERSYQNSSLNRREQHRGSCHFFFNQKNLVGDRETGKIYDMDLSYYDDAGDPKVWERTCPHIQDEKRRLKYGSIELDMETGVGLVTGQGSDPQIMMQYSDDGGRTYSDELWRSVGKIGEYSKRVRWSRLGSARDRVFRFTGSDPVQWQINEAYANAT